jgi:hypothetical protein
MSDLMKSDLRVRKNSIACLSDSWLAIQVVVLLCRLPVLLRLYALPTLLHRLTPRDATTMIAPDIERDRAVRLVLRVCQLRPFRSRLFPRICLRQALALYYTLTNLGYTVSIHFGILRRGEELLGHCWVTLEGMPVAEGGGSSAYRIVYSYPSGQPNPAPDMTEIFSPKEQFL